MRELDHAEGTEHTEGAGHSEDADQAEAAKLLEAARQRRGELRERCLHELKERFGIEVTRDRITTRRGTT